MLNLPKWCTNTKVGNLNELKSCGILKSELRIDRAAQSKVKEQYSALKVTWNETLWKWLLRNVLQSKFKEISFVCRHFWILH
jgi:hypothetical protein